MAALSDLSLGFIVGGSVLAAGIVIGFLIWKVVDAKHRLSGSGHHGGTSSSSGRNGGTSSSNGHHGGTSSSSAHHGGTSSSSAHHGGTLTRHEQDVATEGSPRQRHIIDNPRRETIYSEIIYNDDQSITIIDDTCYSAVTIGTAADSKEDSGFYDSNSVAKESEQYARLHDVTNHVENVYGELSCYGTGQVSTNNDNPVSGGQLEPDYLDEASPNQTLALQHDGGKREATRTMEGKSNAFRSQLVELIAINHRTMSHIEALVPDYDEASDVSDEDSRNNARSQSTQL